MDQTIIPKISVLMPVYNCALFIEESVRSILNQTFTDFELIIIDDCSTDGTSEYLQSLSDSRVVFIAKPHNTGYTNSLNMGLGIAKGKYIARMDGDDISFPSRFEKQVAFMDANPKVVLCGTAYTSIGSADAQFTPNTTNDALVLDLMVNSPFAHPTVFMRNSILKAKSIRYDPTYESAEDYKMWSVLSEYGELANLSEVLLLYRIHPEQTTNRRAKSQGELAKLISFEYTKKMSGDNSNIPFFTNRKLKTVEDVYKYDEVETAVKSTLSQKGIKVDEQFFVERKTDYLKFSLLHEENSLQELGISFQFVYKYRANLGSYFIFKFFVKSLICWRAS